MSRSSSGKLVWLFGAAGVVLVAVIGWLTVGLGSASVGGGEGAAVPVLVEAVGGAALGGAGGVTADTQASSSGLVAGEVEAEALVDVAGAPWALVGQPLELSGRVVDVLGDPIAGATVVLIPSGETRVASGMDLRGLLPALDELPSTLTDDGGRFSVRGAVVQRGAGPAPTFSSRSQATRLLVDAPGCVRATPTVVTRDLELGLAADELLRHDVGELRLLPEGRVVGRVVDTHGAPLPGMAVETRWARSDSHGPEAPDSDLRPEMSTLSGPDGRFVLGGQWTHQRSYLIGVRGQHMLTVESFPRVGETYDLGDIELGFAGGIAGQVVDERGEPVPGASVLVMPSDEAGLEYGNGARDRLAGHLAQSQGTRAVCDDEGRFSVPRVGGPSQMVLAGAPWFEPGYVAGIDSGSDDVIVHLMPAARALLEVVDARTGVRLDDADVQISRDTGLGASWAAGRYVPNQVARGAEARQLLDEFPIDRSLVLQPGKPVPLPDTEGRVLAELARFTRSLVVARLPGYADGRLEVPGAPPGALVPVTLALQPGARLTGVVATSAGEPISAARVQAARPGANDRDPVWETLSDDGGRFQLGDLPGGAFVLSIGAFVRAGLAAGPALELALEPGERRDDLRLSVLTGGTVEGRSLGADGMPRVGQRIVLQPDTPGYLARELFSDEAGGFRFVDVSPGSWRVSDGGDKLAVEALEVSAGATTSVTLRQAQGAWLTGVVLERGSGRPLPGVRVAQAAFDSIFDADMVTADFETLTDAAGRFAAPRRNIGWFGPGDLELFTQVPGSQLVARQPLDMPLDQSVDVRLEIGGTSLAVTVVDELTGVPVPAAIVRLGRDHLRTVDRGDRFHQLDVPTDASGSVRFDWLEAGRWPVSVESPDHVPTWTTLQLHEGANSARLSARPGASVEGLLSRQDGSAGWAGSRLDFRWEGAAADSRLKSHTATVAGGRFRVDGLTPGPWSVALRGAELDARMQLRGRDGRRLELAPGETLALELVVRDDG